MEGPQSFRMMNFLDKLPLFNQSIWTEMFGEKSLLSCLSHYKSDPTNVPQGSIQG